MQLGAAALFVVATVYSVVTTLLFVNHDTMLRALQAQGTQFPAGTHMDAIVNVSIGVSIGFVLFGLGGLSALGDIGTLMKPSTSPVPIGAVVVSELLALASLGMFVWMLVGAIKFGPWAMRKPGA